MTGKDLFREVGNISEKYITEAEETKKSIIHNVAFRRAMGTAACLLLCVGIFAITRSFNRSASAPASDSAHYDAATDGTNNVQMNAAEPATSEDSGYSSDWDDFWNMIQDSEKSESSVEMENNTPEEVVGENVGSVPSVNVEFDKEYIIEKLQSYSNDYEELLQANAFVVAHGEVKQGLYEWKIFVEDAQSGIPASIDLIEFTEEGDAIITAVVYDGETYHIVEDCTRDVWGNTGIVEYECQYLYTDTQDDRTTVILSNLKLEGEEIRETIMADGTNVYFVVEYMEE